MSTYKEFVAFGKEKGYNSFSPKIIIEEEAPIEGEKLANHSFVNKIMGRLMGKMLTFVEATSEPGNLEARKDLIRAAFAEEMTLVSDLMFDQDVLTQMASESFDENSIESVTIEEALGA